MGEPKKHVYVPDHDSTTRVKNKEAYDKSCQTVGIGKQHKNGISSQKGRTTIIFRNGQKIVVRENGKVVNPDEIKPLKRMRMSVWDAVESQGNIEYI